MAFDSPPSVPSAPRAGLSIAPHLGGWAVKHGEGFLGLASSREEALRLLRVLQDPPPAQRRA